MIRRLVLAATLALSPLGAAAQELSLQAISDYLNSFRTAQGGFTQVSADGAIDTGTIQIKRPGRIRFDYDSGAGMFIAGGGQVAVFDAASNEGPERFPLSETPLSILLADVIDFNRSGMITGHSSDGTTTTVTAQDPAHPDYGTIQLVFTADPVELRQWVVTDQSGSQTTVILNDVATGAQIGDRPFNIQAEMADWGR
jgi:outer membrane lipoprotein-sorting protein